MNNPVTNDLSPVTIFAAGSHLRTCDYMLSPEDKSFVTTITKVHGVYHVTLNDGTLLSAGKHLPEGSTDCSASGNRKLWCIHYIFSDRMKNNTTLTTELNPKNFELIDGWYRQV